MGRIVLKRKTFSFTFKQLFLNGTGKKNKVLKTAPKRVGQMLWNKTLKLGKEKKTAIQSRGTLYLQASKCYTAVVLITHEWSTKARWHDQELWQREKALIKCPAHVAFKGFCQQESGSFPKPWSMSVILTTGFRNQKKKNKKKQQPGVKTLSTSARTCSVWGASSTAAGAAQCFLVSQHVCQSHACIYTHEHTREPATPLGWFLCFDWREGQKLGKPIMAYLSSHKLGHKTK